MNVIIIFLCFAIYLVYMGTKNYLSLRGLLLFFLFTLVVFLKVRSTGDLTDLGIRLDNFQETLLPNILLVVLGTIPLFFVKKRIRKFKIFNWVISLVGLYFIFGIVQQFFFQAIFTHTFYLLLGNKISVLIISAIFFSSFHWKKNFEFSLMTLIGGFVFAYLFLLSPNIILLGVSHAILASFYYFLVNEGDTIKNRFSLKSA